MVTPAKIALCLLLLSIACTSGHFVRGWPSLQRKYSLKSSESGKNAKIIGGRDAPIAEFPYQLSLRRNGVHACGASIVAIRWALSAAHCTFPTPALDVLTLRAGSANRLIGGTIYTVAQVINHPRFNEYTIEYDVSLLRVNLDFVGQFISAVTLPPATSGYAPGTRANVSGWGLQSVPGPLPMQLQWIDVPLISMDDCRNRWPSEWITPDMLCTDEIGRDTCNGDSGGPLVVNGYQMGVSSWGSSDCSGSLPAIYANTADPSVRSFIQENTGI
ncbi:trypsin-7-like [Anopheles albimanus]|uniref:trypsin-7-like n=1 Tax=Anopheles albimanus TaxID=7167 RepID=UPI00163DF144|nr:trypsin-7-like [Anopheles albimanus]